MHHVTTRFMVTCFSFFDHVPLLSFSSRRPILSPIFMISPCPLVSQSLSTTSESPCAIIIYPRFSFNIVLLICYNDSAVLPYRRYPAPKSPDFFDMLLQSSFHTFLNYASFCGQRSSFRGPLYDTMHHGEDQRRLSLVGSSAR